MRILGALALTFMFLLSGLQKIYKLGRTQTKQFTDVFGMPYTIATMLIFAAGVYEVFSVFLILKHELFTENRQQARLGVLGLIIFTILVTILFKIFPRFKFIQFLSNLSVLGGLILYYDCLQI